MSAKTRFVHGVEHSASSLFTFVFELNVTLTCVRDVSSMDTIRPSLPAEFVQHLLAAADRYDVPSLREEYGRLLMRPDLITPATVAYTLTLAHQHGIANLKVERCRLTPVDPG
jgi:hypothetical protein